MFIELGGIAMSPPPGIKSLKPGKAMKPSFGVVPLIVDVKVVSKCNFTYIMVFYKWQLFVHRMGK